MTLQGRTFRGLFAGMMAGLLSWLIIDHTRFFASVVGSPEGAAHNRHAEIMLACLGGVFGLLVSGLLDLAMQNGQLLGSVRKIRQFIFCLIAGFFAGAVGLTIGQFVYSRMTAQSDSQASHDHLLPGVIARCLGWAITGLFIGGVQSLAVGKIRGLRDGLIGGVIGGLAGGSVFEAFDVVASNPSLARLAGFVFIGAAIGFFTEAVPVLLRKAWLVIEGPGQKTWESVIDSPTLIIGHSEAADIKLMHDPSVAAVHCRLVTRGDSYAVIPSDVRVHKQLTDDSTQVVQSTKQPVTVDGKTVDESAKLMGGELIGIGAHTLRLCIRGQKSIPLKKSEPKSVSNHRDPPLEKTTHMAAVAVPSGGVDNPLTEAEVGAVGSKRKLAGSGLSGTKLVGIQGPYFEQTFLLGSLTSVEIGRDPECEIALSNDGSVSRGHARVILNSGRHYLSDGESANGTFLNDERLEGRMPVLLTLGDRIRVGDTILRYE